ncbi:MAG: NADH-quinone oxidoreductase subunit N [Phycisphaeraceae bacterium]|nr:NADH-quinone oxidoreductase subunit N [Phycisphaeraceae bacterium]
MPKLPAWEEIRLVLPEIGLAVGMCAVLLVPFARRLSKSVPAAAALIALGLAGFFAVDSLGVSGRSILAGALVIDPFSQFFKVLLVVFTVLVLAQWLLAGKDRISAADTPDFLCLLLGATAGMALMASAANLLSIVVSIEMASLPSYALAGMRKLQRRGSEAALKYVLFGAVASALMIYGCSLLYGLTGSLDLPTVANAVVSGFSPLLGLGVLLLFVGLAFKLSAVPLHFWCPDVFEGAPTEVTTFLSVASKGAAVCLLTRILWSFGAAAAAGVGGERGWNLLVGLAVAVAALGAITATWGNLVAMHQTNLKRLLAYSSMAHAGYLMMAVGLIAISGPTGPAAAKLNLLPGHVAAAVLFYLLVYLFMNMGAFTVVALAAQQVGSEDLRAYRGLMAWSPWLGVLLTVFLLSLFGMPGLGGFLGKIYLAVVMTKVGSIGFVLIAVLLFNTLLSLYYYMRPVYFMAFAGGSGAEDDSPLADARGSLMPSLPGAVPGVGVAVLVICALALVWTGLGGGSGMTKDYGLIWSPPGQAAAIVSAESK